jgi:tRNA A-37 threonylcarbamoyl transferase component Bud32
MLIEGYFPPKFGVWATHKLYRITYQNQEKEKYIIAKIMNRKYGMKELSVLSELSRFTNVPKPLYFLYDNEFKKEGFSDVYGILWMSYIENQLHFEDYLVRVCITEQMTLDRCATVGTRPKFELETLHRLLSAVWSAGIKHNDLKGHHLLFTGEDWFVIDFEKSETFVEEILHRFGVDLLNSRYLPIFTKIIKNNGIESSLYSCIS